MKGMNTKTKNLLDRVLISINDGDILVTSRRLRLLHTLVSEADDDVSRAIRDDIGEASDAIRNGDIELSRERLKYALATIATVKVAAAKGE
jgi:hypothetical protein